MRARCADGPFVGQTFEFTYPETHMIHGVQVGPLAWIRVGRTLYCYQVVSNGWCQGFRLVYRDTF